MIRMYNDYVNVSNKFKFIILILELILKENPKYKKYEYFRQI